MRNSPIQAAHITGAGLLQTASSLIAGILLLLTLMLAGCGGGGGGSGAGSAEWYFHWMCNGDAQCLYYMSSSSGTIDEGSGATPGQSNCDNAMYFNSHTAGWNIPPASQWCDNSPTIKSLSSISVTPATPTIALGNTQQFTATASYSDGSSTDITNLVTWASGSPSVATISSTGLATSAGTGNSTISATYGGITGSTSLTVASATLLSISITPANPSIAQNYARQLRAVAEYSDGSTTDVTTLATWSSSVPSVATADTQGVASGYSPGSTQITASYNSISGNTTVTVSTATLQSIVITPANPGCVPGTARHFYAHGIFSDNSAYVLPQGVTWSSNATSVAGIASSGLASCTALGTTSITATSGSVSTNISLPVYAMARYAYVSNRPSYTVLQNTIGTDGVLSPMTPASLSTGSYSPNYIAVDPSGHYAYAGSYASGSISQFTIGTDGSLTPMTPASVTAGSSTSIAIDPSGKYLYATNSSTTGTVFQFTIGAGGALSAMATPTVATGSLPAAIAVEPTGRYAYVANNGGTVSQYSIGSSGGLTPLATASVAAGTSPQWITAEPSGKYVYVLNGTSISQYLIDADGSLAPLTPATVALPSTPTSCDVSGTNITVDPTGQYLYAACGAAKYVAEYVIGTNGELTLATSPTTTTSASTSFVAIDPSGRFAYASYYGTSSSGIDQFSIGSDGSLTPLSTPTALAGLLESLASTW